jgi:hypothetical protein
MNVQLNPKREALRRDCMLQIASDTKKVTEMTARLEAAHEANRIEQYKRENAFYLSGGRHN